MREISRMTFNYQDGEGIKKVIRERLGQTEEVKYVQKGLILLEYILRTGHDSFRGEVRSMSHLLQSLTCLRRCDVGEQATIEGVIRKKAQDVISLATDDQMYRMEREKANKLKANVTSVGNAGYGGYGGGGYSGGGYSGGMQGNSRDSYDYSMPSTKKSNPAKKPLPPQQNGDEYEYEYEDEGPTGASKPQAKPQQQQVFDPMAGSSQQQVFDPFAGSQPTAPAPAPVVQAPPQAQPSRGLAPPPGMTRRAVAAPVVPQEPFDPFGTASPAPQISQPAPPVDDLFSFGGPASAAPSMGMPMSQPQPMSAADDLFSFGPPSSQPVSQPVSQPMSQPAAGNAFDDLLGFGSVPAPAPPAAQQAPKPSSGMFADFGDIVDINNLTGNQREYGGVGQVQRGSGASLGGP